MQYTEIIIELSHNCNLACTMCGFGREANPPAKDKFMPKERFFALARSLAPKAQAIRLNGRGESTIHPDFLEMLSWLHREYPALCINMFSNMSFRNADIINALIDCGVQLFISLDSTNAQTLANIRVGANFGYIADNIRALKAAKRRPFIVMTVQEKNLAEMEEMGHFALENDCSIICNTIRSDEIKYIQGFIDRLRENPASVASALQAVQSAYKSAPHLQCLVPDQMAGVALPLETQQKTHGSLSCCPALETELCIFFDGTVTPCNMFNPYVYGNVFSTPLDEVLRGEKRSWFLQNYKSCNYCKNCANLGV